MDRQVTTPSYSYWQDVLKAKDNYFSSPSLKTLFALQEAPDELFKVFEGLVWDVTDIYHYPSSLLPGIIDLACTH